MTKRTVLALTDKQIDAIKFFTSHAVEDLHIGRLLEWNEEKLWMRFMEQCDGNYTKEERAAILDYAETLEMELHADMQDE
jgi:hypothetical protein